MIQLKIPLTAKTMHKLSQTDSIIFDLDGTLWNSTATILQAWYQELSEVEEVDTPITQEQMEGVMGLQHDLIGEKLFPKLEKTRVDEIMEKCYASENNLIRQIGGTVYPNVKQVLKELSPKYPLFIVSNCQAGYVESFYHYHKLDKYFTDHECSGNTELPKSENIRLIIERNNLKYPIYIGDTQGDFDSTKANDIPFIFAKYGFGTAENPKYTISDISELPSLLEKKD